MEILCNTLFQMLALTTQVNKPKWQEVYNFIIIQPRFSHSAFIKATDVDNPILTQQKLPQKTEKNHIAHLDH